MAGFALSPAAGAKMWFHVVPLSRVFFIVTRSLPFVHPEKFDCRRVLKVVVSRAAAAS